MKIQHIESGAVIQGEVSGKTFKGKVVNIMPHTPAYISLGQEITTSINLFGKTYKVIQ